MNINYADQIALAISRTRAGIRNPNEKVVNVIVSPSTWALVAESLNKATLYVSMDQAVRGDFSAPLEIHILGVPVIANRNHEEGFSIVAATTHRFRA